MAATAMQMLLAGDVGGTKTLLGLFEASPLRPREIDVRAYPTQQFQSIVEMIGSGNQPPVE